MKEMSEAEKILAQQQHEEAKARALECSKAIDELLKKFNCLIIPEIIVGGDGIKALYRVRPKMEQKILVVPPPMVAGLPRA